MLPSGTFSKVALAVAALLAVALFFDVMALPHSSTNLFVSGVLQTAIAAWAAFCCGAVARQASGYVRQLWMLLTAAICIAVAAQGLGTYYQNITRRSSAEPWPSDILFIFWAAPLVLMMLPRPTRDSGKIDWAQVLDIGQVFVVGISAYLYFFYVPSQWHAQGSKILVKIMGLQWLRDIMLGAGFGILAVKAGEPRLRRFFGMMCGLFTLSSTGYFVYLAIPQTEPPQTSWNDIVWCTPLWLVTWFAATQKESDVEECVRGNAETVARRGKGIWRIVSLCMPLAVIFMSRKIALEESGIAWAAVTGSFVLSATRLLLTTEKQRKVAEELRKTEAALRQSSEMFSTAFRSSLEAIGITSLPDGKFLAVNDGFLRLTGYTPEEVIGKTPGELRLWVHEGQRAGIIGRLQAGEEVKEEEFLLRTKRGEILTAQYSAAGIQVGGKLAALGMARDITARKRAEKLLRASEEKFRSLVENMDVGVVLFGSNAEIQFANFAAQQMFGGAIEEARGRGGAETEWIAYREDGTEIPYAKRPGPREIKTRQPIRNEMIGWKRPGSNDILWTLGNSAPRFERDGSVSGAINSFINITTRRLTEEMLRQLSARLLQLQDEERRRLGRELHDSLAQSVLAVNLDLAQVANSETPLDERAKRALAKARGVLQEMSKEIRTLSYLLHPPMLDELGLGSAIREYAKGYSDRSGIELEVDLPANLGRLGQDVETALFRIVQESLANIQKHSGSERARIQMRAWGAGVELEVSDEGCGIPQPNPEAGGGGGPRLGVGIVGMRERMVQLGGKLEVESNAFGTKVRATVPVRVEAANAPAHPGR